MADLRGFTTFCEQATPRQTALVLNEYLTAMVEIVLKQQGVIQDFYGDGVLGVFGAPVRDSKHACHAVLSALAMRDIICELCDRWEIEIGRGFSLGVAVHTGQVYAGPMGSLKQSKYAVVGDPVNTVARLEELNRRLGTVILINIFPA